MVETYPLRDDMAQKAAEFLASKGIDVSIEASGGHYYVISGKGFTAMSDPDAQAFQRRVIKLGFLPIDGKKAKGGYFPNAGFVHIRTG